MAASTDTDSSVSYTALRVILVALPHPTATAASKEAQQAYSAVSQVLIPPLTRGNPKKDKKAMLAKNPDGGFNVDAADLLIETAKAYGPLLKEGELGALKERSMVMIQEETAGMAVVKRAQTALSSLLLYLNDVAFAELIGELEAGFRPLGLSVNQRKNLISTVGTLGRSSPNKVGPYLKTLVPSVLAAVADDGSEDQMEESDDESDYDPKQDELRETAFITLETLLGTCAKQMQPYVADSITAALRFLKYDPNVAEAEDEEMGGLEDGSDNEADDEFNEFEEEEGYSDIDDLSWKVRRCSAKVLYTVIATQGSSQVDEAALYQQIAPALLSRVTKEREESVKHEVLNSLNGLVKKTSQVVATVGISDTQTRSSRKRRRQDSNASKEDEFGFGFKSSSPILTPTVPTGGAENEVAKLTPGIIQSVVKMWKKASTSLKQAAIILLRSLALVRYGALTDYLSQIEGPVSDALKSNAPASFSAATASNLQTETLSLVSAISETHFSEGLVPFLVVLVPGVIAAVKDKNYKVSSEALATVEKIDKALTPPRVSDAQKLHSHLEQLYSVTIERVVDNTTDVEVRQRAIHVLGTLLGRTSGPQGAKFLSSKQRASGLDILLDRIKNETTRLAAVRAIDDVVELSSSDGDVTTEWISNVTNELGLQLRKSDRTLRGSSLDALKSITINPHTRVHLDVAALKNLVGFLLPLLNADDLHLLTPALVVFAKILPGFAQDVISDELVGSLCSVVKAPLTGTVLKAYLLLVRVIGEQGIGAGLMKAYLQDVGVLGDPAVLGRAIGTLLVYGGQQTGVRTEDFLKELDAAQNVQNKCLALAVLGEVGFRLGPQATFGPETFVASFGSKTDKVRLAAALALGNAGANNIKVYLPQIIKGLQPGQENRYLLLHSLKEILQHADTVRQEMVPFAEQLWQILLQASESEDNRVVGAECVGRLALIDPVAYIPQLQEYVSKPDARARGTVIAAFRYTLADTGPAYADVLRPLIVPMLSTMLADPDLGNHRLALSTVTSAVNHQSALVVPRLPELMPAILGDTVVRPELVREVQMGPFRHRVDDGLELRKVKSV